MTLRTSFRSTLPRAATAVALVIAGLGLARIAPAQASAAEASAARATPVIHVQSRDSGPAVHHDKSASLASMAALAGRPTAAAPALIPVYPVPHPTGTPHDPAVQDRPGSSPAVATTSNFDGIGSVTGYSTNEAPPDPNTAVGTTQVVEIVNTALAVYSKTGATIMAATDSHALWQGFSGTCAGSTASDPTVSFDRIADRWVIQQLAFVAPGGPFDDCVAVSVTDDATGSYFRYAFQSADFLDYPKLAVWPSAYFVTFNLFAPGPGAFIDAETCALDRASMLAGAAATQQCFTTSSVYFGLLPADLDGAVQPPPGEDETVIALGATNTTLAIWKFHVDFASPANSSFTGPAALTVDPYTLPCGGTGGTCVPQGGTTQQLDTLGDRLMYRAAYRNFGDHQSIVVSHTVTAGSSTGMRWYELRLDSAGTVSVFQQGTYAPDSTYRWMGSIAQDKAGDIALGYSQSSSSTFPSIRFTSRAPGDPLGEMTQAETTVLTGGGSETGLSRWGDYTSMAIDPVDDCTFWYTDQYEPSTGSFNWQTRLASFQLPGCAASQGFTAYSSPSLGITAPGNSATTNVTVSEAGTAQAVGLSASGLPAGVTATFSPASLPGTGTSTLALHTSSATPDGAYPITITGAGATGTETITYTLVVGAIPSDFALSLSPLGEGGLRPGQSVTATVSTGVVLGFPQSIAFTVTGTQSGITATISPASVMTGGSATLTINTTKKTPSGNYTLTITGTSPTTSHSVQFMLGIA